MIKTVYYCDACLKKLDNKSENVNVAIYIDDKRIIQADNICLCEECKKDIDTISNLKIMPLKHKNSQYFDLSKKLKKD